MWKLFSRLGFGHTSSDTDDEEEESGLQSKLTRTVDNDDSTTDDKPCNVSGHDWQPTAYSPDYYARSVALRGNVLKVKKKTHEKCRKCDNYRNHNEWIGKIRITEDDELEVV